MSPIEQLIHRDTSCPFHEHANVMSKTSRSYLIIQLSTSKLLEELFDIGMLLSYFLLLLQLIFRYRSYFKFYLATDTVFIFKVLGRAEAAELPVDHDSNLCTQSFSLLHGVSSQHNSGLLSLCGDVGNNGPHKALGLGIDSSTGLVQ